jgi:hypothetical protein
LVNVGSVRNSFGLAAILWLLLPALARADVKLDVRTDRTSLSLDDTLTLQITVQSQGAGSPRIELPTFEGFQVVSQQVQRPMQFSFNFGAQATVQSSTIYTFSLQPLHPGTLVIKPVRVELDGRVQTSRPIQITVGGGNTQPMPDTQGQQKPAEDENASGRPEVVDSAQVDPIAFLRTVVDKAEPYEGEQVTVTIYLYVRERLQAAPNIETEPTTDGLWIHDLLPPNHQLQPGRQVVGNDVYAVYVLRRVAAFPLRSGDVTIGPMSLEIDTSSLFDLFAPGRARPNLKRSSQTVTLHVKPLPEAGRPAGEIAVGRFTLVSKLDRSQAVAGDAITLTATVQGQGNIRSARIDPPHLSGVDVLQPETKDLVEAPNDLVGGTREYRFLLVQHTPGHVAVPALVLSSFDPSSQRYQRVTSTPLAFDVVGNAVPSTQGSGDPKTRSAERADQAPSQSDQPTWAPIRTQSRLQRSYAPLAERPFYLFALAAPLLVWLSLASASMLRRRLTALKDRGPGRALRLAEERLQSAEAAAVNGDSARFYAEASAALLAVLEARLTENLGGLTRSELRERLVSRGMEPRLVAEVLETLERSETVRFSSASATASVLDAQAERVRALFKELAAFEASGAARAA